MCYFEYTIHGCGHMSDTSAQICRHMGEKVKPKVHFPTMTFAQMASWVRVCTQFWGDKSTRVYRETDTVCDECVLKDLKANGMSVH